MDRLTLGVVGGVLVLGVAGLAAAVALRGHPPQPDLSTPSGIVLAYGLAEERGDAPAAWELLATTVQARNSRDQFLLRLGNRANNREYQATESEKIDGDTATVVLVRTNPSSGGLLGDSGYTNRNLVRLV